MKTNRIRFTEKPVLDHITADSDPREFRVLGVRVHAIQIPETIQQIERWIGCGKSGRYVAFTGMHGIAEARKNSAIHQILNAADLVVPDGMPLVWLARLHRYPLRRRVYGPDLMEAFCWQTGSRYRHFFYGGKPGVAEELARKLQQRFNIIVAGTYTPPFRPLTEQEEKELEAQLEKAAPDLLWVGLSTPKQERWMYEHRSRLRVPVMLGVGAAFDLHSGNLKQAPLWMREHGLEWFFRLVQEPSRLWRRYLLGGAEFLWNVSLELLGLKQFN